MLGNSFRSPTEKRHHLISDDLRQRIQHGEFADRLPGQRVLADEYEVNFLTVRKALATLSREGLIVRKPGKGTFVTRLRRARHNTLAALVGGLSYGIGGQYGTLIHGIQEEAAARRNDLIINPHHGDPHREMRAVLDLIERKKVDGVLIWPTRSRVSSEAIRLLEENGIPFVVVMRIDAEYRNRVSYVTDDDRTGGALATRHLIELGHRRIGFVCRSSTAIDSDLFVHERWLGFLDAHRAAGLEPGPRIYAGWTNGLRRPGEGQPPPEFLRAIDGVTGVVCMNDHMAIHLSQLPDAIGCRIPERLSIVGYDDIEAAELFNLTTIHQPMREIGSAAVRLLLDEIEERRIGPETRIIKPRLEIRGTTAEPFGATGLRL